MEKGESMEIHGEPSFRLANGEVEAFVTRRGGHLAPVRFQLDGRWAEPYALAPWRPDEIEGPPVVRVLRGDFFCLPFGSSPEVRDVHGDTANETWQAVEAAPDRLVLEMNARAPSCRVRKTLSLRPGHRAVYQEHRIEGLSGRWNFGHHAILLFPEVGGHVNVGPFRFGSVKPEAFSNPLAREYGALKTGGRFKTLAEVPLAAGGKTSLHAYPARQGFEDLVLMASKPGDFAWTAATLDGYVWISLKDPRVLPSTLFWLSNGGRHGAPWNGSHFRRLGLEEVCGHYSDGPEESRKNRLKKFGIPTAHAFRPDRPETIRVIHLVHPVPKNFGKVVRIDRGKNGTEITIKGDRGPVLRVPVDWGFLHRA